ncbi:hypothetical protein [Rhodopila sp.]|uniref:hypothetical protein n=1 Tax=Rhodopila sp. TaxID=2480087 RepID=UPI003D0BC3DB
MVPQKCVRSERAALSGRPPPTRAITIGRCSAGGHEDQRAVLVLHRITCVRSCDPHQLARHSCGMALRTPAELRDMAKDFRQLARYGDDHILREKLLLVADDLEREAQWLDEVAAQTP